MGAGTRGRSLHPRDPDEEGRDRHTEISLFDEEALYVGARLYDTDPARISRRVTARDEDPGR